MIKSAFLPEKTNTFTDLQISLILIHLLLIANKQTCQSALLDSNSVVLCICSTELDTTFTEWNKNLHNWRQNLPTFIKISEYITD